VHSAAYPEGLDLKGKRVAVVGTGSSGIQIVANIQKEVEHLYVWGRSAGWLTAGFAQKYSGPDGANFMCTFSPHTRVFLEHDTLHQTTRDRFNTDCRLLILIL
jgi:cation diffusion facilitator CzcD-associated flavoprotein CzcO